MTVELKVKPLTREGFQRFGDVIDISAVDPVAINQGTTQRYNDLATVEVTDAGGHPLISIFRAQPRPGPIRLEVMERHPLGTQAFYPLQPRDWLLVVSNADNPLDPDNLRAFRGSGCQGVNYARNIWHHPLLVLEPDSDFLVVDRGGPGANLEEVWFSSSDTAAVVLDL